MSKLSKVLQSPKMFFSDARKKFAVRQVDNMSREEQQRFGLIAGSEKTKPVAKAAPKKIAPKATPDKKATPKATPDKKATPKATPTKKVVPKMRNDDLKLAAKLLHFERSFPVNSLQGGDAASGLMLWPYFRHLFWVRCQADYKGKNAAIVNTSKQYVSRDWQQHYTAQLPVKTLETLPEESLDFLFFTNLRGTEQTRIDNRIYNRITDPIFEVARTLGRAKKVEVIKGVGEIWPHREHDVELVLPPMLRKVGYAALTDRPKDFLDRVHNLLPEAKFDEKSYNDCVEWFFHQRDFYLQLLQRYNPKVVFFVGFDYHYALVCAAKELGIETVDLQHGVQSGWSPVYNHWQAVPYQGYGLLPDTFWVWGEYDAGKIRNTFGNNPDICGVRPLVGGFPWLDRQQDFVNEALPEALLKLQQQLEKEAQEQLLAQQEITAEAVLVTESAQSDQKAVEAELVSEQVVVADDVEAPVEIKPVRKVALLTLQDQTVFPPLFAQIIEQSADRLAWLIKRHPKHQNIDLSAIKGKALYGKAFDSVSFLTLIGAADIHLTECSTAVIEADYFGVPSVVTGEQGILNYSDFIEQGTVHHVESANAFNERLDDILAAGGEPRMGVVDNTTLEQALRNLLEKHSD